MSAPPVPTSSTVSRSGGRASASIGRRRQRDAAEPAVDASEVAQVPGQGGRVVERAVEQLSTLGEALHRAQATRRHRPGPARDPGRDAPPVPYVACRLRRRPLPLSRPAHRPGRPGHRRGGLAEYPTQSLGNRGADVRAIQGLLTANGVPTSVNGLFRTTDRRPR